MARAKSCTDGRTDPRLWSVAKRKAMAVACQNNMARCAGWDARMAQDASRRYQKAGGEYCGPRTKRQKQIVSWKREDWTTWTGKPACTTVRGRRVCDRYLPDKAWNKITSGQRTSTRRVKLSSDRRYVQNTPPARAAARRYRQYVR